MNIQLVEAEYTNNRHASDIVRLLDTYARDPMGGGKPLEAATRNQLVSRLAKLPYAFSLIAYDAETAVGLANCFQSFSTFAARPLINIHDFMVVDSHRGRGISQLMLAGIESIARSQDCCKITLEVLSNNPAARSAYRSFGFTPYQLTQEAGIAQFWQKPLHDESA